MKVQKTTKNKANEKIRYSSQTSHSSDDPDRRQQEMKRRFGILQSRRGYLERELNAVKTGLSQLDQQMQSYSTHKQLSMQHRATSTS